LTDFTRAVRREQTQLAERTLQLGRQSGNPDPLATVSSAMPINAQILQNPEPVAAYLDDKKTSNDLAKGATRSLDWMAEAPENPALVKDELPQLIDWERTVMRNLDSREAGNVARGWDNFKLILGNAGSAIAFDDATSRLAPNARALDNLAIAAQAQASGEEIDFNAFDFAAGRQGRTERLAVERFLTASPEERTQQLQKLTVDVLSDEASAARWFAKIRELSVERQRVNFTAVQDLRDIRSSSDLLEWGVVQGVPSLGIMVAIMGAGLLTGGVGGAALAVTAGTAVAGGEIISGQIEDIDGGFTMYTPEQKIRARQMALLSGSFEALLGPTSRISALGARSLFNAATRREVLSNISEPVLRRVSQGYLRRIGAPFLRDGIEEFVAEGAQTLIEQYGVKGELKLDNETLWAALNGAVLGGLTGGSIGMTIGARGAIRAERTAREIADAGQTVQTMDQLAAVTQQLKLAGRSPSKFSGLVQRLGLNNTNVFFQSDDIVRHAQEIGITPEALVRQLGGSEADLDAARSGNGRIAVSASGVVKSLAGQSADFIKSNASITPQGFTPDQAKNIDTIKQEIEDQAALQNDLEGMAPKRADMYRQISSQLKATGRMTDKEIEANTALATAFFETMGTRYGQDAQDLFQRMGFDVTSEAQQVAQIAKNQKDLAEQTQNIRQLEAVVTELRAQFDAATPEQQAEIEAQLNDAVAALDEAGIGIDDLTSMVDAETRSFQQDGQAADLPDGTPRQFDQSVVDQATADVEDAVDIETQQEALVARIEGAGGEILEFNQIDGLVSSDQIPVLTAQDMIGMKIFPTVADRTAAAAIYTGIDGAQLNMAVPLLGGPFFPLRQSNWDNSVVWANRGASVTSAKETKLAAGATHMLVTLGDQNMHISNTTVNYAYLQTFFAKMESDNPPDAAKITDWLRNWQKDAAGGSAKVKAIRKDINNFPSFDDKQALIDYTHKISFDARKQLMKLFSTGDIQGMGGPNVQAILDATREQSLAGMNWGDGVLVIELDRGKGGGSFTQLGTDGTTPHPDFPLGIRGRVAGRLETPLGWKTLWKDWLAENADKENPRRAFELSRPVVEVTEQLAADLANASSVGVQTPLHAKLVARLIDGEMKRTGVAKNKGGIGPADYFNEANIAAAGSGAAGPIRATLKDLNAGIKSGEIKLAQVGEARVFSAVEGNRITHIVNNESGTEGLGETVAILDAIREGATEVLAPVDSLLYNLAEDLGFVPTDEAGVLRLEGDTNGYVERYIESGPAGLVGAGAGAAGRATWRDGYGSGVEAAGQNAGAELAAAATGSSAAGTDTLASRAGRVAAVLKGLKPEALDNLGLDAQDVAALQGGVQTFNQDKRGQISLPDNIMSGPRSVITLFQKSDKSTFTHEAGHFFLQAMKELAALPTAPTDMVTDMDTINEFLGRPAGDQSIFTVEQQEQWAQSFEKYIETGKAPSVALRTSFERLRKWIVNVYRQFGGLNMELPQEVTEVMDRMLATDDAIAIAKAEQDMGQMLTSKPANMTEETWAAYRRAAVEHDDEAAATLLAETMEPIRRARSKGYRKRRDELRAEIAQNVDASPEQRTVNRLTAKGAARLDRKQLVDIYGEEAVAELDKHTATTGRKVYGTGEPSIEAISHQLGYKNAATLFDDLRELPSRQDRIDTELRMRLREEFSDALDDGSIKAEAMAALHKDKNRQLMMLDLRFIVAEIEAAGGEVPTMLTKKEMEARVEDDVAETSVRTATQAQMYLKQERDAARKAQTIMGRLMKRATGSKLRGTTASEDLVAAFNAKESQIFAHMKYNHARDTQAIVDRLTKAANQIRSKDVGKRLAEPQIGTLRELFEKYDFRKKSKLQLQRDQSLLAYINQMIDAGNEDQLAFDVDSAIATGQKKHFSELTVDELQELEVIVKNLMHVGRSTRKILDGIKSRAYQEVKTDILVSLEEKHEDNGPSKTGRADGAMAAGTKAVRGFFLSMSNADNILRILDRAKRDAVGVLGQVMAIPVQDGMSRAQTRKRQNAEWFERDLWKSIYGKDYVKKLREFTAMKIEATVGGSKEILDGYNLMTIALNTGADGNMERLTNKGSRNSITKAEIERVLSENMTTEMWTVVDSVWAKINELWPEISALEVEATGVKPKQIKTGIQIKGAPSFVKSGGYFPIRYDRDQSVATVRDSDREAQVKNMASGKAARAQTKSGWQKTRIEATGDPLSLSFHGALAHMNDVVYDLELRLPVAGAMKILKDRDISSMMTEKGFTQEQEHLKLWVEDVANGDRTSQDVVSKLVKHLREGTSVAAMAYSWTTLVQQPLGLFNAVNIIGSGNMVKGFSAYMGNMRGATEVVMQKSPFMAERQQTMQRDMALASGAMREDVLAGGRVGAFKQALQSYGFIGMQKLQFFTVDMPTWYAAYGAALEKGQSDGEAVSYADRVVARAHGSGVLSDRSAFERGTLGSSTRNSEIVRAFTTFQTFIIARLSVTSVEFRNLRMDDPATFMDLVSDLTTAYIMPSIFASLLLLRPWDEREQDEIEDLGIPLWWLKTQLPAEFIGGPIISQAMSAWEGFGSETSFGSGIGAIVGAAKAASKLAAGEGSFDSSVTSLVSGAGIVFKLPSVVLNRAIKRVLDEDGLSAEELSMLEVLYGKELTFE
jgi:hypothetical protein